MYVHCMYIVCTLYVHCINVVDSYFSTYVLCTEIRTLLLTFCWAGWTLKYQDVKEVDNSSPSLPRSLPSPSI